MKSVRKISNSGSITIPSHIRKDMGLGTKEAMEIKVSSAGDIVLSQLVPRCSFCDSDTDIVKLYGKNICKECCSKASALMKERWQKDE